VVSVYFDGGLSLLFIVLMIIDVMWDVFWVLCVGLLSLDCFWVVVG